ncbi:carboxypeptidase regulatory-like domain-containing protein [Chondromyces crocatus]|uniref:Signal protein PDZ n=1 Tax=Chondromyces crocatus TaxID=52 RepID=A0A0K1EU24_CHOCO|nr:carboxypeptidase regulatory-like domain-containing protein [Chondromyces crocatus]AKT44147.1 signal protein PDZ [Chondromyces crocatus]
MSSPSRAKRPVVLVLLVGLVALLLVQFQRSASTPEGTPPQASSHPSSRPRAPRLVAPERRGPLRLPPGEITTDAAKTAGSFSGRVVSSQGVIPIAGATLTFEHQGDALTLRSGADGTFSLEPPEPGVYALALVSAEGFHPFAPAWGESPITLVARPGEAVRGLTITLDPAITYAGVVLTPAGEPAKGADVRILDAPGEAREQRFVTDDQGAFSFTAPEDALLEASHPDHAPGRARLELRAQTSRRLVLRLRPRTEAQAPETIGGRVVDAAGTPVVGATVSARWHQATVTPDGALHPGDTAITDEQGTFLLDGLDPGQYQLTAREGDRMAQPTQVASGTRDATLRLGGTGRIRGVVRARDTGKPVTAFSVVAARHLGPLARSTAAADSFFDASGAYEILDLLPGTYAVTATAAGHAASATATVDVTAGNEVSVDLTLGRGGSLHGVVVEEGNDKPIEGVRVSAEENLGPGAGPVPIISDAITDASGRFSLQGLSEGPRSIVVVASKHHGRIVSGLQIAEGRNLGPITIALTALQEGEEPRVELTGIGAVLAVKDDALVIVGEALPGGGAAAAGLGPGDAIVTIDGVGVVDLGFTGSIERIRGPEGSVTVLTVRRGGAGTPVEMAVRRLRIRS